MWCSATALPLLPREGKLLRVLLGALRSCASAALGVVPIKAFLVCGETQVPASLFYPHEVAVGFWGASLFPLVLPRAPHAASLAWLWHRWGCIW